MDQKKQALLRELRKVSDGEQRLYGLSQYAKPSVLSKTLSQKLPPKVLSGLETAFYQGFSLLFRRGSPLIQMTVDGKGLENTHRIQNYAFTLRGTRKELRDMGKTVRKTHMKNLAMTTAEGVGLGALGVGLPDLVLFLSAILKGCYETALEYGFSFQDPWEQMILLKMLETSLSIGPDWERHDRETEDFMANRPSSLKKETFQKQIHATSQVFAMDLLTVKFIQGLPLVGVFGGAANPFYYHKVLRYVKLKYRKRYLKQTLQRLN